MKKIITAILFSSLITCFAKEDLQLKIHSSFRSVRLGDSLKMFLYIEGSEVHNIVKDQEGVVPLKFNRKAKLSHEFEFEPQREGPYEIGPVSLSMNGQKLISNKLVINVLPPWNGECGTFFRVDKNSILLGEEVELVVETWATNRVTSGTYNLDAKKSKHKQCGYLNGTNISPENNSVYYIMKSWLITPEKTGTYLISESLFRSVDEEKKYPNISISVSLPENDTKLIEPES